MEAPNIMTYRMITAPVIIPRRPDCDYNQGEPPLTDEQVHLFKNTFENYQLIDYDHQITDPNSKWYLRNLGTPVRSWISTEDTTYTNVAGKSETIPAGSWWLQCKVTDPEAVSLIDEGLLTAYSITVGNRAYCDKFIHQWQTSQKNSEEDSLVLVAELLASKHKTLIKDIVDPVGFTVSLTGMPCVGSAMFSRKCLEQSQQADMVDVAGKHTHKNGGEDMPEETETKFSIKELLGLKDLFATKSEEEPKEEEPKTEEEGKEETNTPKNDYITREELDQKFDDFKGEIVDIFDEKLEKVVEKLTVKKEEPEPEPEEGEGEGEGDTANKHKEDVPPAQSSQLDNTDDGNNQNTANKNKGSDKAKLMAKLNRKPNGEYKFPKNI